jgi:hypothetical protein
MDPNGSHASTAGAAASSLGELASKDRARSDGARRAPGPGTSAVQVTAVRSAPRVAQALPARLATPTHTVRTGPARNRSTRWSPSPRRRGLSRSAPTLVRTTPSM